MALSLLIHIALSLTKDGLPGLIPQLQVCEAAAEDQGRQAGDDCNRGDTCVAKEEVPCHWGALGKRAFSPLAVLLRYQCSICYCSKFEKVTTSFLRCCRVAIPPARQQGCSACMRRLACGGKVLMAVVHLRLRNAGQCCGSHCKG